MRVGPSLRPLFAAFSRLFWWFQEWTEVLSSPTDSESLEEPHERILSHHLVHRPHEQLVLEPLEDQVRLGASRIWMIYVHRFRTLIALGELTLGVRFGGSPRSSNCLPCPLRRSWVMSKNPFFDSCAARSRSAAYLRCSGAPRIRFPPWLSHTTDVVFRVVDGSMAITRAGPR